MIELRLLGPLQIGHAAGSGALALLRRSKRTALLAYLAAALPRGLHRRDKLVALFWPESDATHARAALNQALYVLRDALGSDALIARGDDGAGLNADVVWCDVAAFEAALDAGRPADALELYRGDLLDGFHASGAAGFEEWLDRQRARLRRRAADGAWALAEQSAAAQDDVSAGRWARHAAELDPIDEAVVRRLMSFLHRLGDGAGAIQVYESFAQRLAGEYELRPSSETQALAGDIRRDVTLPEIRLSEVAGTEFRRRDVARPEILRAEVAPPEILHTEGARPDILTEPSPTVGYSEPDQAPEQRNPHTAPRSFRRLRIGIVSALLPAIFGVLGAVLLQASDERTDVDGPPRLAVLAFENLGGADDEYFADGITDEISGRLAQIAGLVVISPLSAMQYKGSGTPLRRIGDELGVAYALEGTIRTDGVEAGPSDVRVIARLVRTADGAQIWTDRYTARLSTGEIFRVQADIAEQVAVALNVALRERERVALAAAPTGDLLAYDYYIRGNQYYGRSFNEGDTRQAGELYERATASDSSFAIAWARLGMAHLRMYWFFYERSARRLDEARRAIERAAALDPDHPEVHLALGYYHYWGHNAYDPALAELRAAAEHQPNSAELFEALGNVVRRQGSFDEAVAHFGSAFVRNPRSPIVAFILAQTLALTGDHAQATHYFERAVHLRPAFVNAYWNQARLHLSAEGSTSKARAALESWPAAASDPLIIHHAALVDVFDGRLSDALERVSALRVDAIESQFFFIPVHQLKAQIHDLSNAGARARAHYDSARITAEARLLREPGEANYHSALAIAYAGLGRRGEAIAAARRGVDLLPLEKDAWRALFRIEDLARVHVMLREHDAALDALERLTALPGGRSVAFLSLDPVWGPLRSEAGFARVMRGLD